MQIDEITPIHVGAAPLIRGLIDKLNITEIIDEQASKAAKQAKLSVGTRIKAMIIQILTDRKALYRMEEWYAEQDVELLVGPGVEAQDLNDDALSRALDHLGKMDFNSLYSKVAMQGLALLQDPSTARFLHMDTTSLSVYGQYEKKQEDDSLTITHGYSKDYRPDLKQFKFGLACTEGLPVYGDVHDGNTNDGKWTQEVLPTLKKCYAIEALQDCPLIGDAAFVTKENLKQVRKLGVSFLSRLPERYALAEKLKTLANRKPSAWESLESLHTGKEAATYRVQGIEETLDGHRYRFLIVQSSALDKRKKQAIEHALHNEKKTLEKAMAQEAKKTYTCKSDACQALTTWLNEHPSVYRIQAETVAMEIPAKRGLGRPRKDQASITVYQNRFTLHPPPEAMIEERRYQASSFVLITNLLDTNIYPNEALLRGYKEQYRVEQRFRFLKSPYFVGSLYFQKPERVQSFGWVMLLALMVYSYLQQAIRTALKKEEKPLLLPGKRKSFHPTGLAILELLEYELILQVKTPTGWFRQLRSNKEPQLPRILQLLQLDPNTYTRVPNNA